MQKYRLLTPGPTPLPENARMALGCEIIHHRTSKFRSVLADVLDRLKYVFVTKNDVLVFTSSGTGAMEAAVSNLAPRDGKVIVLESGKFSERWRKLCEKFGIEVVRYEVPWGQPFDSAKVAQLLQTHPDAACVYATLSETSTAVGHDIEAIGRVVRQHDAVFVVDGISGVGVMECQTDDWGIDVLVVGSQKALMGPPGLAFLAISPAAWRQIESIDRQAFYFDLISYRNALKGPDTPFTPAEPLVVALAESLKAICDQGIENVWRRAKVLAQATRESLLTLGMKLLAERPSDGLTAAFFPDGIDGRIFLEKLERKFGIKLAAGQGPVKGKIFRIAHMGMVDELDIIAAIAAIELVLVEMGQSVTLGAGVTAAERVIANDARVPTSMD